MTTGIRRLPDFNTLHLTLLHDLVREYITTAHYASNYTYDEIEIFKHIRDELAHCLEPQ